jgi:hypothetical protein
MKATEMLNKIKTFLGEETTDIVENIEKQEVELAQAKLDNDTVLEAEAFEAGNEVFIVTEDDKVALPVGDYTMEDGKMLVVAEEGIIAEIKEATEEEVEAEEDLGYVTKEELAEAVSEIKAMIEDMKKEEMSEEVVEEATDEVELSDELPKEVKEELSEPAAEPIAHNPEQKNNNIGVKFAQNRKQTTLDKVMSKINN